MTPEPIQDALEGLENVGASKYPAKRSRRTGEAQAAATAGKPTFRRRKMKDPPKCDECVSLMIEGGKMSAPNRATYDFIPPESRDVQHLCWPHTSAKRAEFGLKPLVR